MGSSERDAAVGGGSAHRQRVLYDSSSSRVCSSMAGLACVQQPWGQHRQRKPNI